MSLVSTEYASSSDDDAKPRFRGRDTDAPLEPEKPQANTRRLEFCTNSLAPISLSIRELLSPTYGSYLWPSALVLSAYISQFPSQFNNGTILELGCGTGLPGQVVGKLGAKTVILTDLPNALPVLENVRTSIKLNDLESKCFVKPLKWGCFPITQIHDTPITHIIGADIFYNPPEFDSLLATVAYILCHNPSAKFITAYQERSSSRTIQHLLDKWGLACKVVDKKQFGGWGECWHVDGVAGWSSREIASVVLMVIQKT